MVVFNDSVAIQHLKTGVNLDFHVARHKGFFESMAKILFKRKKERHAGGAQARSGCFQHQQLRLSYVCTSATAAFAFDAFDAYGVRRCGSVMPVCKQPVATLTLQTFAKVFLGRRLHSHDEF